MSEPVTAAVIFHALEGPLHLRWITGHEGGERLVRPSSEAGAPNAWAGMLDLIHPHRIQILGSEEIDFLLGLAAGARADIIRRIFQPAVAAVLVCGEAARIRVLCETAGSAGVPLWQTRVTTGTALDRLSAFQHGIEAASTLLHGVFMEVYGLGVLLTGGSGTGKSELALELISRNHRLIADDTPQFTRVAPNVVEGICPPALINFLEVRGLGIVNVRRVFGDSAVKRNKRLRLIVNLVRLEDAVLGPETRLQGARRQRHVLDVPVPEITLPIAPGRNLAVLVECAVRDHMLRLDGYNAEQDLMARLQHETAGSPR